MSVITSKPPPVSAEAQAQGRLRPRRTLNRLALGLAGVAVGGLGQLMLSRGGLWEGLGFYLLAIVLLSRAVGHRLSSSVQVNFTASQLTALFTHRTGWPRPVGAWLILLAGAASGLSYLFFGSVDGQRQAWWLYLTSLGLMIAGVLLLTPGDVRPKKRQRRFSGRAIAIGLIAIVWLAFFLRLHQFSELPFGIWFDEAEAGLEARHIVTDPNYRPVFYPLINVTGQQLATYALALSWFGDNIYSLRLVSVLFGLGGVLAAYLFGQELRGPRFGLALAFLVAVARWHINFSRIAMTGVDAPFFEFLSLYFLLRLFKHSRLRDALWAGLTIGLGLMFYTAFRLYLLALLIFAGLMALRRARDLLEGLREGGWRRWLLALGVAGLTVWLVVMPVVRYAWDNPDAFLYRTRQISIFTKRDQPNLGLALWDSAKQHLLMFNYAGDRNGRHNLPGEPMLDPITGVLFVLGVGLAALRIRQPANLFFLILLPAALIGGIFSVDFEAPQALRSIAVIPAVVYLAALPLVALGREAELALRPLPPRIWLLSPAVAAGVALVWLNAQTYFVRQANDFATWNAFSAPETITGRQMARLGPEYAFILSPFLTNHPTVEFLAPNAGQHQVLTMPDALPVREPTGRPVAMFIHPDDVWVYDLAGRFYPNADYEVFAGPGFEDEVLGPPSVYYVGLDQSDLLRVRGLELSYWPAAGDESDETRYFTAPLQTSRAPNVNVTWPADAPTTGDFYAEWNGILYVPSYGGYHLRLTSPAAARLEIDGNPIFDGIGQQQDLVTLAIGNHHLRLRAEAGAGQVALFWQPPGQAESLVPTWALYSQPVTNHGLLGRYFPNNDWSGPPALERIDPFLNSYFHLIPLQRPYTVEWSGSLVAPQSGVYRLGLRAVQEASLFINGQPLLATVEPDRYTEAPLTLAAGRHELRLLYRDSTDRSRIHLLWTPPDGQTEPVPSDYLWPPMGAYPELPAAPEASFTAQPLTLQPLTSLGSPGSELGQFLEPRDVAVLSDGSLVVADTANRRVQIFDPQLQPVQALTGDDLAFEEPLAVAANSRDEIFILDATLQWIYQYDAAGNFMTRFGGPTARFFFPRGLSVLDDGTIAVADTGTSQIKLFDPTGEQIASLGQLGNGPGQLNEPTDVLRDAQGNYFVVEAENDRIQQLDPAGYPLRQWEVTAGFAFDGPHLAFAPDGSLFMTESQSGTLQRYSPDGNLLDQWQMFDSIRLNRPLGLYFDSATDRLYITDIGSHQVHIFWLQPETAESLGEE